MKRFTRWFRKKRANKDPRFEQGFDYALKLMVLLFAACGLYKGIATAIKRAGRLNV